MILSYNPSHLISVDDDFVWTFFCASKRPDEHTIAYSFERDDNKFCNMVARSRFIYSLIFLCVSLLAKDEQCICTGFSVLRENLRIPSTRSIRQTRKESPIPHQSPSVSELNQGKETEQDEHEGSLQQQPSSSSSSSSVKGRTHFWTKQLLRQLFAEAIGTFIIVQMGTCAVMSAIFDGALVGLFQIASVWIIAVTVASICGGQSVVRNR